MRLCHENALMVNKMQSWLREYGVEKQNPKHFHRALEQTLGSERIFFKRKRGRPTEIEGDSGSNPSMY